jgi:hypothetical protein
MVHARSLYLMGRRVAVLLAFVAAGWWIAFALRGAAYRLCLALAFSVLTAFWCLAEYNGGRAGPQGPPSVVPSGPKSGGARPWSPPVSDLIEPDEALSLEQGDDLDGDWRRFLDDPDRDLASRQAAVDGLVASPREIAAFTAEWNRLAAAARRSTAEKGDDLQVVSIQRKLTAVQSALTNRMIIGQATGLLMERYGLNADRAFKLLVSLAHEFEADVNVVASRMVSIGEAQHADQDR